MGWSDLDWPVVGWSGLKWTRVTGSGLELPGVAWSGLAWVRAQFDKAPSKLQALLSNLRAILSLISLASFSFNNGTSKDP